MWKEINPQKELTSISTRAAISRVDYGTLPSIYDKFGEGTNGFYTFAFYKSGYVHDVIIGPLEANTVYYYKCGGNSQEYSFKTPPPLGPEVPVMFAVAGDLGQTKWTSSTLDHIQQSNHDVLILPGDLSYADYYQPLWDSFGRLVEPLASSRPWMWLQADLAKLDRTSTPWLIAIIHAPWYSNNSKHQGDGEEMRKSRELTLGDAPVDLVFASHVHACERTAKVFDWKVYHDCGIYYITIGDGGNREGLARTFLDPTPDWSVYREASFGHGILKVLNSTHAHWIWHRNQDNYSVVGDELWLTKTIGALTKKQKRGVGL
ncbi:hypothetical protein KP509_1Z077500 [Ceratopteris richardii]|nr:hypothetical protein KP509_1Z077500 [Ceratopteris richardii]